MNKSAFYITTAIDYANGSPHLGHALEKIGADAIARYQRLCGRNVHFVMGMDEYGQKVEQSAAAAGITPQQWTDNVAAEFQAAWKALHISNDDFIRTTEPRHREAVLEMIRRMEAAGDIYLDTYAGFYCVGCEAYKSEDDLVDGRCPEHPSREIQWMEEEDRFFRLSRFREPLLELVDNTDYVRPESRRNEVRRMIEDIKDISVSRSGLDWGIRWPGHPEDAVYVWIDALTNYLSASGFPAEGYREIWPANLHVIGKDIVRFHCLYWPAMLMSAGVEVPQGVWAHGWMTMGGEKISKSEGISVQLGDMIDRYGADALRYFVLREIPWNGDGMFTIERYDERYTADLANDLGNLANRTVSMIHRYRGGVVPEGTETSLHGTAREVIAKYRDRMDRYLLHEGSAAAFELVSQTNGFVEATAPWKLAKDEDRAAELDSTLRALAYALAVSAVMLYPFMPEKMKELWQTLGGPEELENLEGITGIDPAGWSVSQGAVLFPKPEQTS